MPVDYRQEFPDFDNVITLPDGWEDVSWKNDVCPSFFNKEKKVILYLDYEDPAKRENATLTRYGAYPTNAEGERILHDEWSIEGDDLADVLKRIDAQIGR